MNYSIHDTLFVEDPNLRNKNYEDGYNEGLEDGTNGRMLKNLCLKNGVTNLEEYYYQYYIDGYEDGYEDGIDIYASEQEQKTKPQKQKTKPQKQKFYE